MSSKTKRHLNFIADVLEGFLKTLWRDTKDAMTTVKIDAVYGKAKYRKRARQPRPIVQRTVIYRQAAPRVVRVGGRN